MTYVARRGAFAGLAFARLNPIRSRYDVAVIGAGLGGLTLAASLARSGQSVLVVERNARPGGNCSMRTLGAYTFDVALHEFTGGGPLGQAGAIFDELGVGGEIDFRDVDPFMVIDMPDASYALPTSLDEFHAFFAERFPHESAGLAKLFRRIEEFRLDSLLGQRVIWGASPTIATLLHREVPVSKMLTFPATMGRTMLRHQDQTTTELLADFVRDPCLVGVLSGAWPYLGAPPHLFAAILWMLWVSSHGAERQGYPVGGSQKIADVLAGAVRRHGGDVVCGAEVTRVIVDGGSARGVEIAGEQRVLADVVVSNVAPRYLYERLVDARETPVRFARRLERMRASIGPFVVYLGVDLDVGASELPHETIVYDDYDQAAVWARMAAGYPAGFSIFSPAHVDRSFAPPGHGTVTLTTMFPWHTTRDWRTHEDAVADEMIAAAERRIPGLSRHVKVREVLTPDRLRDFTHATHGAMYGWENSPDQVVTRRMAPEMPIANLYQVGHWTQPGTGMNAAVMSGWMLGHRLRRKRARGAARVSVRP